MKTTFAVAAVAAALTAGNAYAAGPAGHADDATSAPWLTHYAALEIFYHVVADKRFVGSYVPRKGACSVSVLVGPADDRDDKVQPMQLTVEVKASQSVVMQAGRHQSLDIACGVQARDVAIHTLQGDDTGVAQTN